jgi:hypothetical protein
VAATAGVIGLHLYTLLVSVAVSQAALLTSGLPFLQLHFVTHFIWPVPPVGKLFDAKTALNLGLHTTC